MRAEIILGGFALMLSAIFLTVSCAKKHSNSSGGSDPNFSVSEITQTAGSDGLSGSFVIPDNGISFLLSIFLDNNNSVAFKSLTDPDGTDILSSSSTPNLYFDASGSSGSNVIKYGYANVLVPQSPSFSAKAGTWTFTAYNNDHVKLALRTGTTPSDATIAVQPFITGTSWSAGDISDALSIMSGIYLKNGITLTLKSTITITETKYSVVSPTFTNTTTSALIKQGSSDAVNIFFIEDYSGSGSGMLGNAAGMPGSMRDVNSWNGVMASLTAHAKETGELDAQLLGETAAHEMGHQLGLFHTTEKEGTVFDILSDTPECLSSSHDNDSNGTITAEECDEFGGENLMFWTTWSSASRSAGKKQETLSSHQQHVLKYSPIAKELNNLFINPDIINK
tara:strand:+ start:1388 stop:2569 length:1182 start_codon:yes stop_codon:yes gene_type:complete